MSCLGYVLSGLWPVRVKSCLGYVLSGLWAVWVMSCPGYGSLGCGRIGYGRPGCSLGYVLVPILGLGTEIIKTVCLSLS